jgi:hypothetical protein
MLWIDATAEQLEYNSLPYEDAGVPALIINDDTTDLTLSPVQPVENNQYSLAYQMTLTEDGNINCALKMTFKGNFNWQMRSWMQMVPEAKYDLFLRMFAERLYSNAKYDSGSIESLKDPDLPLTFNLLFHIDNFAVKAGEFLMLRLPWQTGLNKITSLPDGANRTVDAEIAATYGKCLVTIRLELPAGYTPEGLKPEVGDSSPWGSFRLTYSQAGKMLTGSFESVQSALRVLGSDAAKYTDFISTITKETEKQLVLKKTAAP